MDFYALSAEEHDRMRFAELRAYARWMHKAQGRPDEIALEPDGDGG
jgi:hypothetical protein